ncbi:MAG: stage II sporulation protein M [Bacteroidetes bacterium]|nr:stage II sporulation protein M [Bacteroidota bacterium]
MKETNFIDQNKDKWGELEELLKEDRKDPDKLTNLFVKVTDDLSYARTFYPNRYVRVYLNDLAQQLFHLLYKNKKSGRNKFISFWTEQLPDIMYSVRKELLASFVIFVISLLIGIFSARHDPGFAKLILGSDYVKMTEENIRNGDPMGVYKKAEGFGMFLQIGFNNLRVAFFIFVLGIIYGIGSAFMVIYNGIMVGVFQYFFYRQGLFLTSFLTIWMHGTLEMSSMIIAGAAGITMGKGLVFPGTFRRNQSFFISTRRGIKILVSLLPIITLAAFIESFLTRHTEFPTSIKALIIVASFAFMLFYFVIYPYQRHRKGAESKIDEADLQPEVNEAYNYEATQSTGNIFKEIFNFYKIDGGKILRLVVLSAIILSTVATFLIYKPLLKESSFRNWNILYDLFRYNTSPLLYLLNTAFFALTFHYTTLHLARRANRAFRPARLAILHTIVYACIFNLIFFLPLWLIVLTLLVGGPFIFLWYFESFYEKLGPFRSISNALSYFSATGLTCYGNYLLLLLTSALGYLIVQSPLYSTYIVFIKWNYSGSEDALLTLSIILVTFTSYFSLGLILPFLLSGTFLNSFHIKEIITADGLKKQVQSLATPKK